MLALLQQKGEITMDTNKNLSEQLVDYYLKTSAAKSVYTAKSDKVDNFGYQGTEKLSPEATEKTLTQLITSSDYLYLHFPDGWQFNYTQSFLNRIRNEVEFFLKLYE